MRGLQYLKLGGSLITDKSQRSTAAHDRIERLAAEIRQALDQDPDGKLLLGHGSGSFGHIPARKYGTRAGVNSPQAWRGFAEVWYEATMLTRIVISALEAAGVPAIAFSPSAGVSTADRVIQTWNLNPIRAALEAGLVPVVHGDVIFDSKLGGTILSTEDLFVHLAQELPPERLLLAGIEPGVWADYPACKQLIPEISAANFIDIENQVAASGAVDVTGGMASKVKLVLELCRQQNGLQAVIFDGLEPGRVTRALMGDWPGTRLHA